MTAPHLQVRRATVEDLPKLVPLWKGEDLPWQDLEKHFKEFQLVEDGQGEVLGAVGLQIAGHEGRLHCEVFARPDQADAVREKLWERAQIIAKNHGLVRIWTQFNAPFWHANGLRYAADEVLAKLPPVFAGSSQPWLYVQLKDDTLPVLSIEKEFARFKEAEHERTQQLFRQAKVLKVIAAVIVVAVFLLALAWAVKFFQLQKTGRIR